jgi:hypothetical protein
MIAAILFHPATLKAGDAKDAVGKAISQYFSGLEKARSDYRRDLAAALSKAERIEIYLLDFETEQTPSNFLFWENQLPEDEFPIIPHGSKSKVLKRVVLTREQRAEFVPLLRKAIDAEVDMGKMTLCHYPIHGVRFSSGEDVHFQSSFCWVCRNFVIPYPGDAGWMGLEGGELQLAFERLLPIPRSEMERFKAKYGKETAAREAEPAPAPPRR